MTIPAAALPPGQMATKISTGPLAKSDASELDCEQLANSILAIIGETPEIPLVA